MTDLRTSVVTARANSVFSAKSAYQCSPVQALILAVNADVANFAGDVTLLAKRDVDRLGGQPSLRVHRAEPTTLITRTHS